MQYNSEPIEYCKTCDRERSCYSHMRAEFPPDAARKWLKRTCPYKGPGGTRWDTKKCDIYYKAGFIPPLIPKI